jgi:DNA-binding CsgD family transcriptional regulator
VEAVPWINDFKSKVLANSEIGIKFTRHVAQYMRTEPIIENNQILQERVIAAAQHFIPNFTSYQSALENHPLITEHREVATVINENLAELLQALIVANYFLQYCQEPFSVTSFLQHKLKWAQQRINISCYASSKKQVYTDVPNSELFDSLKRWRDMICNDSQLPIYMVANQNSLKEIATYLPITKRDLMQIPGFGKAKAEKYGDEILELVQEYCNENSIESNMQNKEANPKKIRKEKSTEVKTDTKTISFNLFKEGKTIAEIAKERTFTKDTIFNHLAFFVASRDLAITELISEEKYSLIEAALNLHGRESVKLLKENLPEDISFAEIRIVMAAR